MSFDPRELQKAYELSFNGLEEAVAYLQKKGYVFSWNWQEQIDMNHAAVFTIAKAMKMDILQSIRDELTKSMKSGTGFDGFKKNLEPLLKKKGWWGKSLDAEGKEIVLGTPWRLRTIYKTNMQSAFMAGRWEAFEDNKEDRPYLMYVAVMDDNTRPEHAALNGQIHHIDSPFWDEFMPPNAYGCRCRVRALTKEQYQGREHPRKPRGVEPDAGFRNNPAKEALKIKRSDYSPDIWEAANP